MAGRLESAGGPAWWSRLFPRHRTIWPTREGWWFLFVTMGLGVAAVNTGNNLLYLLVSMLLGLIVVSGVLSELSMRGVRVVSVLPDEVYAGRPGIFGATVTNHKRRLPSYSITIDVRRGGTAPRFLYLLRLEAGASRLHTWPETLPRRGRQRLPGLRVTTLFPFGLFLKAGRVVTDAEVIVYPAVRPVSAQTLRRLAGGGTASVRRRGRGSDLYNLRDYRSGDDPRLIHWRSSAKAGALMVRELEAETAVDARIVLEAGGGADVDRLESGLAEAASLAVHLLRTGARVEVVGPGLFVPLGAGRAQERRILAGLALYDAAGARRGAPAEGARAAQRPLREFRVRLG